MQKKEMTFLIIILAICGAIFLVGYFAGSGVSVAEIQVVPVHEEKPARLQPGPYVEQPSKPQPLEPVTHEILMWEDRVSPNQLTINKGDSVVWQNHGSNRRRFWIDEKIYSDLLEPGESYTYTFETVGSHTFRDVFNGKVVGDIEVLSTPSLGITGNLLSNVPSEYRGIIGIQLVLQVFVLIVALAVSIYVYRKP